MMGFIDSSLEDDVARMSGGKCGCCAFKDAPVLLRSSGLRLPMSNFRAGAEHQRDHAPMTLRFKAAKYAEIVARIAGS